MRLWAFLFWVFLVPVLPSFAQTDSTFEAAFSSLKDDPAKIDSLNDLCMEIEDGYLAIACEKKVIPLAEKINYKKGLAWAYNNIGITYKNMGKGKEALEHHMQALKIREELGNKKEISSSFNNLGNTYDLLGDKKQAIEYHRKALELREALHDTIGMAKSFNNIASAYVDIPDYYKAIDYGFKAVKLYEAVGERSGIHADALNNLGLGYAHLEDFDKALSYYQKALSIQEELEDNQEIARMLDNIGVIYHQQGQKLSSSIIKSTRFNAALKNYFKALEILKGAEDNDLTALIYNNIGNTYWELNDFPNALVALNKSLDIYKKIDNKNGIANALNSLSYHYKLQKNYPQAINYALRSLPLADSISDIEQIKNATEILRDAYRETKQFEISLFYFDRYSKVKDQLTNVEGAKKLVQEESKMEFEKQEQKIKLEREKERIIAEEKSQRQKLIIWGVIAGLVLVALFAGFILNRWRITQKQKKIIEEQKHEVDEQKKLVEEKNKDITDSINYAERIQRAVLPHRRDILRAFPESFVLFRPKDIVSGDFYWALSSHENSADTFFIGCCDCTGHGVPGAFMSLLNISLLNQAVKEKLLSSPDEILGAARTGIINALNPDGASDAKDGMDAVLCAFDRKTNMLHAACANNPIWYIQNGEVKGIKPDKMPVGSHMNMHQPFTKHSIQLHEGDTVYLFTDGYADQFGGPKNKKFRYKQLEELLLANNWLPMKTQKDALEKAFMDWKGTWEQVDDVLVIGIRI